MILNSEEEDGVTPIYTTLTKRYVIATPTYALSYLDNLSNLKQVKTIDNSLANTSHWSLFKPNPLVDEYESEFTFVKSGLYHISASLQFSTPPGNLGPFNVELSIFFQKNGNIIPLSEQRIQALEFNISAAYNLPASSYFKADDGDKIYVKAINVLNNGDVYLPYYGSVYTNVGTMITLTLIK